MEFIDGSRGIYRPIRMLFDTPIYECCWHISSFKSQVALMTELLRLQQKNQLPAEVTAEDMSELLVERSKNTLRVKLWDSALENFDEVDIRPLLKLVWDVNTSMKMRDVEFDARRLLTGSPEAVPAQFQSPKIICQAQRYSRSLTEQQEESTSPKLLHPREVVIEVVPKVLQGFWLPPPNTSFNMPSQQLSKMAVGVTKAVEDRVSTALSSMLCQITFSRSTRDKMVLSIQERVRQDYTQEVLVKRLNCFAAEVLQISDVAAEEICALFQTQTHTQVNAIEQSVNVVEGVEARTSSAKGMDEEPHLKEDTGPSRERVSDVITPPAPLISKSEFIAVSATINGLNSRRSISDKRPTCSPDPDSTVITTLPPPLTPTYESPAMPRVQMELIITVQPVKVDESFNNTNEVKKTNIRGCSRFLSWLQKNTCCSFQIEDTTETE